MLSENRARLALSILKGFQDAWPNVLYIRNLLERLLRSSSNHGSDAEGDANHSHSTQNLDPTRTLPEHREYNDGNSAPIEAISPLDTVEQLDDHVYNLLLTPVMPMFSFNHLAEDVGLGPDFWTLDQVSDESY